MHRPYGVSLFCEDVRHEIGGKVSYMGIYGTNMNIGSAPPIILPRLSVAVHMYIPVAMAPDQLRVVLTRHIEEQPAEELMVLEGVVERPESSELPDDEAYIIANMHMNAIPFQVDSNCVLKVRGYIAGEEVRMGTFTIGFVEPQVALAELRAGGG